MNNRSSHHVDVPHDWEIAPVTLMKEMAAGTEKLQTCITPLSLYCYFTIQVVHLPIGQGGP
jgi:hypothetical protein